MSAVVMPVLGCGDELPPPSYIEATEIFTIRHGVEIGPLNPERVGPLIAGAAGPIAEVLPGDRVRLEAVVVDIDGVRLAEHELETLWLQCGARPCVFLPWGIDLNSPGYDTRCDDLELYTTDDNCLLGTRAGAFEFTVPELGSGLSFGSFAYDPFAPRINMMAVVAWDGRRATDCWDARRGDLSNLDRCGFIYHHVAIGPSWWAFAYAAQLGFEIGEQLDPAQLLASNTTSACSHCAVSPSGGFEAAKIILASPARLNSPAVHPRSSSSSSLHSNSPSNL
jgi:hypothetical protein